MALLVCLFLVAGCAAPGRAIPQDRAIFEGRAFAFGKADLASGERAQVLEIERAGPRDDASVLLVWRGSDFSITVLDDGHAVERAAEPVDVEEAARLLSPVNPAWGRGLERWLAARTDVAEVERALAAAVTASRAAAQGFMGDLADAFRAERASLETHERDARRHDTWFFGLFGWQRGAYSGYSWSFPFHLERYDRAEDAREVAVFPLLSGFRSEHGGVEVASIPLLGYYGDLESPLERSGGLVLLGAGRVHRASIAGETSTTLVLPLLSVCERASGEEVAADGGRLVAGERSATHLLASLVHWSSERPGIYRDRGALRSVGRARSSWRVLPLASHRRDEHGGETMLWPLLGFGWGEVEGKNYVRLFYFLKIG